MLVLSRKVGERIHIGDDVFLEVRRVAGNRITVAINAPKNLRILRGELLAAAGDSDVLEDSSAEMPEAAIDTVIMSAEQAALLLPSELSQQNPSSEQSETVS